VPAGPQSIRQPYDFAARRAFLLGKIATRKKKLEAFDHI
jgi:hypothetical protein